MSIPVVTVGDSREDLVGRLERLHGPVSVVRRCSELAELLAACQGGLARAAVVAQGSEELTASLVDRLSAVGVAVLALTDSPEEKARLQGIGVDAEVTGVDAAALASRITGAVARLAGPDQRLRRGDGPGICRRRPGARPLRRCCRGGAGRIRRRADHCGVGPGRIPGPDHARGQHGGRTRCRGKIGAAGGCRQLRCQRRSHAWTPGRGRRSRAGLPPGGPGPPRRRSAAPDCGARGDQDGNLPCADRNHPGGPLDRTPRRGAVPGPGARPAGRRTSRSSIRGSASKATKS